MTALRRLLPRRNLAASVYGTVLVSSVMVGLGRTGFTAGQMMVTLAVTAFVFALAHAWSNALALSASDRKALAVDHVLDAVRHEWPMVTAVGPALLALTLAAAGSYSAKTGLWIAMIGTPSCCSAGERSFATGRRAAPSSGSWRA